MNEGRKIRNDEKKNERKKGENEGGNERKN